MSQFEILKFPRSGKMNVMFQTTNQINKSLKHIDITTISQEWIISHCINHIISPICCRKIRKAKGTCQFTLVSNSCSHVTGWYVVIVDVLPQISLIPEFLRFLHPNCRHSACKGIDISLRNAMLNRGKQHVSASGAWLLAEDGTTP